MKVLLWILAFLGIALGLMLIFVLFTGITIRILVEKKSGKKLRTSLEIQALGGLFKKKLQADKKPPVPEAKEKKTGPSPEAQEDGGFFDKVKSAYGKFLMFKEIYRDNRGRIRRSVHATRLQLSLEFGLGDAAHTGIATGAVWAGIYNVVAFAAGHIRITEPRIAVVPLYNQKTCSLKGECIIKARVVNLIITAAGILISYYFKKRKHNKLKNKKGGE